jgi:uncharacterized phiE125 gp8 family phage protein
MYKVISTASTSPVTVADLQQHLMLFGDTSYDAELAQLVVTATEFVSDHMGEFVANTTIAEPISSFSDTELVHKNVSNVVVKYFDENNVEQTLAANNYIVDQTGNLTKVKFKSPNERLSADYDCPVQIEYSTAMTTVPNRVKHAILITAAELFEVRTESTDAKNRVAQITIDRLLSTNRRVVI